MFFKKSKKITVKPDLSNVDKVLNTNLKFYLAEIENINRNNDKVFSEVDSLKEMFLEQNNRITSQEDELSKYRKGYDNLILKNFYEELIDLHELIEEYEVTKEDNQFEKIKKFMNFIIQDLGIEKYNPKLDLDIRETKGLNVHPDLKNTTDKRKDGKIFEVLKPGYIIKNNDNTVLYIRNAVVRIFKFIEEEK